VCALQILAWRVVEFTAWLGCRFLPLLQTSAFDSFSYRPHAFTLWLVNLVFRSQTLLLTMESKLQHGRDSRHLALHAPTQTCRLLRAHHPYKRTVYVHYPLPRVRKPLLTLFSQSLILTLSTACRSFWARHG